MAAERLTTATARYLLGTFPDGRFAAPSTTLRAMEERHQVSTLLQVAPFLRDHGIEPKRLMQALGLPGSMLLDAEAWIDRRTALRVGSEVARLTGDEFCGIHVAELNRFEQFGAWGRGILQGRNLRESLQFAIRHIGLIETGTRLTLDCRDQKAHVAFGFDGDLAVDPRQDIESSLLFLRRIIDLTGEPMTVEAHFAHVMPRRAEELERVFGPRLAFEQEDNALVFDRSALDLPLRSGQATFRAETRHMPATSCETPAAVFRVLKELIEFERPTVSAVATLLSMNPRTLQRHLAAWGLTFDEMLDEYRKRQAIAYLNEGRYSITDIGFRLGYSDSAHFTRAFRRWTGRTPRAALSDAQPA